jgi:hypothetical protein
MSIRNAVTKDIHRPHAEKRLLSLGFKIEKANGRLTVS